MNTLLIFLCIAAVLAVISVLIVYGTSKRQRSLEEDFPEAAEPADGPASPTFERRESDAPRTYAELRKQIPMLQTDEPARLLIQVADRLKLLTEAYPELKSYDQELQELIDDASRPLMVVVMGQFKTGKSTFINTLLGFDALKTDVTPSTAAVTMLVYGESNEVVAHMVDGRRETFSLDRLHALSAEGDEDGAQLREQLSYLEVRLPVERLRRMTIVDTPGLNSDNAHHTRATEYFMDRADKVLWLFSYSQAASRTDMASLQTLKSKTKPIGIVNRIDEHDPEEIELDEFLSQVRRKAGDRVSRIIGVSAHLAQTSKAIHNQAMWEESRFGELESILETELETQSRMGKLTAVVSRLARILTRLHNEVSTLAAAYVEAHEFVHQNERALEHLREQLSDTEHWHAELNGIGQESALERLGEGVRLPEFVDQAERLNKQMTMLQSVCQTLHAEGAEIERKFQSLSASIDAHNAEHAQLAKEFEAYNKSGMFGGRPILDWDGTLKKLNSRDAALSSRADQLNARSAALQDQQNALARRYERNNLESHELIKVVLNSLQLTIDRINRQLKDNDSAREKARQKMDETQWSKVATARLERLVGSELEVAVTVLESILGKSGANDSDIDLFKQVLERLVRLETALVQTAQQVAEAAVAQVLPNRLIFAESTDLAARIAEAKDGSRIELPEGVYRLSESLVISKSLSITGVGAGRTTIQGAVPALLHVTGEARCELTGITFDLEGAVGTAVRVSGGHIKISDCSFAGVQGLEDESRDGAAVTLESDSSGTVIRCEFRRNHGGIDAFDQARLDASDNIFAHQAYGILSADRAHAAVSGNTVSYSQFGVAARDSSTLEAVNNQLWYNECGIAVLDTARTILLNNACVANEEFGIALRGVSEALVQANTCCLNLVGISIDEGAVATAYDNICEWNWMYGVEIESERPVYLEGNTMSSNEAGIVTKGIGAVTAAANTCDSNDLHGIYAAGGLVVIQRNRLSHNADSGVTVCGNASVSIEENTCIGNIYGISAFGESNVRISANECLDSMEGIILREQTSGVADGNRIHRNQLYGIHLWGTARFQVEGNHLEDNGLAGIYAAEHAELTATNNRLVRNTNGIAADGQARVRLSHNSLSGGKLIGMSFMSESSGIASHNHCNGNLEGIQVSGTSRMQLDNNVCAGNTYSGIALLEFCECEAKDNKSNRNGGDGIFVAGAGRVTLRNNECRDNAGNGIYIEGDRQGEAVSNTSVSNQGWGLYIDQTIVEFALVMNHCQFNQSGQNNRG